MPPRQGRLTRALSPPRMNSASGSGANQRLQSPLYSLRFATASGRGRGALLGGLVCAEPGTTSDARRMTAREVIRRLTGEGWYEVRQSGGHKQFKHDQKPGLVTVPVHGSKAIPKRTLASIFRQAGWKTSP
jgi:predicted RNA binding protein YcfA (HicA-like mRNA interferase family)